MIRYLITLVLVLAALAHPLSAGQARTYQDGLKRVGDNKPLIVFCYGVNFDKINREIYEMLFKGKDRSLLRVLARETYVIVPVYQQPTDAEKRDVEKVMGKSRLPGGIWSYPCLALVDGQGRFRGAVQSSEELESPEKAAEALSSLLEDYNKQQKLLEQASRVKGASHERLMREALAISRIRVPNHESYDPSQNGLGEALQVMDDMARANAYVRGIIAQKNLTLMERQMALVALAGHMRRSGKVSTQRMRALYTEIRNIDPKSIYGIYAQGALELWVIPFEKDMTETASAPTEQKAPSAAAAEPEE